MRIGIDMGGTKIEGVALSRDGVVIARKRLPTPRSYDASLDVIVQIVQHLERETGERATIGVGIPGAIIPETQLVKNANSVWLIGQPLGQDLERALGRPVRLMNDANCFALSEAADGAAAGASVVFGVILGTGVGGGIVIDGRCIEGVNQIAGEWGHNPLPWREPAEYPGPDCYCGKRGCIEAFLSGPGLAADYRAHTGRDLSTHDIVEAAGAGVPSSVEALNRYRDRLARALTSVINLLDPHVIVLGGGMSNIPDLATDVSALLPKYVFTEGSIHTRIVRNLHGDSSGVRGAAWLWPESVSD